MTELDHTLVTRFASDLDALSKPGERIGLAVSGGPDSLALLLLAAGARQGLVEVATIDHALRPESSGEAAMVARTCAELGVSHRTMSIEWDERPESAIQERARTERYLLIAGWMRDREIASVCTAHHRDDQAETLLMRLARGSGVRGLAAMRPRTTVPGAADLTLLRPLLDWGREELAGLCRDAGVTPVDDPSNRDESFERVRVRRWLTGSDLDVEAIARSATNLRSADEAIDWIVEREWAEAVAVSADYFTYLPGDAPAEVRRRVVARIVAKLATEGDAELRGGELGRLLETLDSGGSATLRGVVAKGGSTWSFKPAPARTSSCG